jgi:hypothetical protein
MGKITNPLQIGTIKDFQQNGQDQQPWGERNYPRFATIWARSPILGRSALSKICNNMGKITNPGQTGTINILHK